jgi:hypothetical protein
MVVTVNRGSKGIKEYLEHGQKKDRDFNRNTADKRVTLQGDLELTDEIINSVDSKSRYYHFTLSFKEDHVSEEDMQKALDEFKKFTFAAYSDDEYNLYAEIHYPKLKSYTDKKRVSLKLESHIYI